MTIDNPSGFRASAGMVAAFTGYGTIQTFLASLPEGAKLFLVAMLAAFGNWFVEYLRFKAAEAKLKREKLEAEPVRDTLPPDSPRGFATLQVLAAIAIGFVAAIALNSCAQLGIGVPRGRPIPLAVKESGELGRCASSGYEVDIPPHATVATVASVCVRPYSPADAATSDASAD